MSPQARPKPRRRRTRSSAIEKSKPSTVILYGAPPRVEQVEKVLQGLDVTLSTTAERPSPDATTLGVVIVTPLVPKQSAAQAVRAIRDAKHGRALPLFAVVANDTSDPGVRQIYEAGATAVFQWPREALLLPRLVAELLGVALVRGRASGPNTALNRTLTAHLRLIPWSTAGVRAAAKNLGEVHLSGAVTTYWRKREIERLVARIPGVTRIVSTELRVEPTQHTDRQIARAVRSTLRNTTAVDEATVSVAVHNGAVSLAGTVSDRRELERILELVSNVAGVRDLADSLVVSSKAKQRDGATARRLSGALSKWFPRERITVTVFARVAVIAGKVRDLSRRLELEGFVGQDPAITRVINKIDVR